jgi:DNA-binding IclR family transcriptional regulator
MGNDDVITLVAWNPPTDGPTFACRSDYVEQCWTPLLGPSSILLLRLLETIVTDNPVRLSLHELAHRIGVADSVARRTLLRLKQFRHIALLDDGTIGVRTQLPALAPGQARRIPATAKAMHHRHLAHTKAV